MHALGDYQENWAARAIWNAPPAALPAEDGLAAVPIYTAPMATYAFSNGSLTHQVSPLALATIGNSVRENFAEDSALARDNWWNQHGTWWNPYWGSGWPWGGEDLWSALASWWHLPANVDPVEYDYGNNIVYQGTRVTTGAYGNELIASSTDYYTQAENLANYGVETSASIHNLAVAKSVFPTKDGWRPLGVYSLVQDDQTHSTRMFQLAVNQAGQIRGNSYDVLKQLTEPVFGHVDKQNMRAAWTVGNNRTVVYDTGVGNLLQNQSPILIHLSKEKTEQLSLVRMQEPGKETPSSAPPVS